MIINLYFHPENSDCALELCKKFKDVSFAQTVPIYFYDHTPPNPETVGMLNVVLYGYEGEVVETLADGDYSIFLGRQDQFEKQTNAFSYFIPINIFSGIKINHYRSMFNMMFDILINKLFIVPVSQSGSSYLKYCLDRNMDVSSYYPTSAKHVMILTPDERQANDSDIGVHINNIRQLCFDVGPEALSKKYFLDRLSSNLVNSVGEIENRLRNSKYILLIRNPYACASAWHQEGNITDWEVIGSRILSQFVAIREQVQPQNTNSLVVKYENMCDNPNNESERIRTFLNLSWTDVSIAKEEYSPNYDRNIINLNESVLSQLPEDAKQTLKTIFSTRQDVFDFFGYTL